MIDISLIVCFYNGGEFFKKNIESVSRLKIPDNSRVEFLFVDNNATDGSGEIAREYVRKYPDTFRYLHEPKPGKSYALNLGIKEAKGEIIAFTDSDVILPEDWLLHIKEGFEEHDCAALGGRILPVWEVKPDAWFEKEMSKGKPCDMFGLSHNEHTVYHNFETPFSFPIGCNCAVKKEVFLKYGGFRIELGPRPGLHLGGEDTEFFCRIHNAGERIVHYNPMLVYHQISAKRLTKQYYNQIHLLRLVATRYIASLYPGMNRNKTLKKMLSLPELLFKLILSGFSEKLTTHSNFHYRMKLQSAFCGFSYSLLGINRTIKLLKLLGCKE